MISLPPPDYQERQVISLPPPLESLDFDADQVYNEEEVKTPHSVMPEFSNMAPHVSGRKSPIPIDYLSNIKCKGLIYQIVREPG